MQKSHKNGGIVGRDLGVYNLLGNMHETNTKGKDKNTNMREVKT